MKADDPRNKGRLAFRSGVYARRADVEADGERSVEDVVRHAREVAARADAAHEDTKAVLAESHAIREQVRTASPDVQGVRSLRERLRRWQAAVRERNGDD